ncbi:hypothetical protein BofuT4_uP083950.1 [Botrytis cinerea T4]|uniref:Uncharacterized protein n=1 Tax=Botryotinia fuckeliana (strain T4) TaxID=999810 RepID=G2YJS5_BOTF4|nr:hypothetical protein BofuT4_uP083950.1 [Botrytis cinerea T4]
MRLDIAFRFNRPTQPQLLDLSHNEWSIVPYQKDIAKAPRQKIPWPVVKQIQNGFRYGRLKSFWSNHGTNLRPLHRVQS